MAQRFEYLPGDVVSIPGMSGRQAVLHVREDYGTGQRELFLKSGRVVDTDGAYLISRHRPFPTLPQTQQLLDAGWTVTNQQQPTADSAPIEVGMALVFLRADVVARQPTFLLDVFWLYGGLWAHAQRTFNEALTPAMAASVAGRLQHDYIAEKIRTRLNRVRRRNGDKRTREEEMLEAALRKHTDANEAISQ